MQKTDSEYDKARDAQRDVDQPSSSDFALDVSSTTDQDPTSDAAIKVRRDIPPLAAHLRSTACHALALGFTHGCCT